MKKYFCLIYYFFLFFIFGISSYGDNLYNKTQYKENYRIGVSWYERRNYALSVYYLEKAFSELKTDPVLAEYLYFSYKNMNRIMEANTVFPYLSFETKKHYSLKGAKALSSLYFEGGILANEQKSLEFTNSEILYSESHLLKNGYYFSLSGEQDVNFRFRIRHGVSYSSIPGILNVDSVSTQVLTKSTDFLQVGYFLNCTILLPQGWKITPFVHLFYIRNDGVKVSTDSIVNKKDEFNFREDIKEEPWHPEIEDRPEEMTEISYLYRSETMKTENLNYIFALSLNKNYKKLTFSGRFSYMNLEKKNIWQGDINLYWFPVGNLDLYIHTKLTGLWKDKEFSPIAEQLVGLKLFSKCWTELAFAYGNMQYYNECEVNNIYAITGKSNYRLSVNCIFSLSRSLSVSLLYRFMEKEHAIYYWNSSELTQKKNAVLYSNNLIGGIQWKF